MTVQTFRILGAMLEEPEAEWYGLALLKTTGLKSGTVYPILSRLEDAGWVESAFEDVDPSEAGRPRRRLYRLTGEGARAARAALADHIASLGGRSPAMSLRPGGQPA